MTPKDWDKIKSILESLIGQPNDTGNGTLTGKENTMIQKIEDVISTVSPTYITSIGRCKTSENSPVTIIGKGRIQFTGRASGSSSTDKSGITIDGNKIDISGSMLKSYFCEASWIRFQESVSFYYTGDSAPCYIVQLET